MLKDFKQFIMKGNVLDLAVAVVIGAAFGKIVSSLVADIITPLLGIIMGKVNFATLKYVVTPAVDGKGEVAVLYGQFIQNIFDFVVIAFSIFLIIRIIEKAKRKKEEEPEEPEEPAEDILLLTEIRDLLKK